MRNAGVVNSRSLRGKRRQAKLNRSELSVNGELTPSLSSPLQPPGIPGLQYSTNPLVGLLPAVSNAQHPLFACRLFKVHGCLTGISECRYVVYFQSRRRGIRGATLATRGYPLLRLPADQALSTLPATVRAGRGAQSPARPYCIALVRNVHRTRISHTPSHIVPTPLVFTTSAPKTFEILDSLDPRLRYAEPHLSHIASLDAGPS